MSTYPELSRKVIVVTGAVGNLGSTLLRRLHTENACLVLIDRSAERLSAITAELGLNDADVLTASADITDLAAVEAVVAQAVGKFGQIDGLVNVAGGFRAGKAVHDLDTDSWDAMFNLNARSVFLVSGAVAKTMIDHGTHGRIVTIASRSALQGTAGMAAYSASKSVALRIVEAMAGELMDHGITVNAVLPSVIDTPINRQNDPTADYSKWVSPDSLADVIAFLLSDGARDISGASIPVYGRA